MPAEKTEREIATLIGEIARGEIKLPEIQRSYVWKPTQVAKLIESLYRGYPTGSLLFWKTGETPRSRGFALDRTPPPPVVQPLYLLDGQQRLTALSRALGDNKGHRGRVQRRVPSLSESERGHCERPALGEGP